MKNFYSQEKKIEKKIKVIFIDSREFDTKKYLGKFDLIFIDGGHTYSVVKSDTEKAFEMISDRGIIIWHDYSNLTGNTILWRVFAGILDGCPKEKLQNLYHISNTMCAIYINKKLIGIDIPSQIPNKTFTINISSKKFSN